MKVVIIGGGAAGFFAAISAKENHPDAEVVILEKSQKLLAKVKVSGGGRCNVTNGCASIPELCKAYPRGGKKLKKPFHIFNTKHTCEWFESRGVALVTQDDGCVFPVSQDSQTIIDCLMKEVDRLGISVRIGTGVQAIRQMDDHFALDFSRGLQSTFTCDRLVIATGGSPKRQGLQWLEDLGHKIEDPVPSLFTFNMPNETVRDLMGIVVENAQVNIQGTKLKSSGPLLITHWGMSGPAILVLSSFGARILSEMGYQFKTQVNWVGEANNEVVLEKLQEIIDTYPNKLLANQRAYNLPDRLWNYLLTKAELSPRKKWSEVGKKGLNKLTTLLTNDIYEVSGKTTFKEEFVTCGGVCLQDIDMNTMQSKIVPGLYFTGEVMDIDAITGGYNFQGAWTTGFIAGKLE
ncbi:MAG: putative Rossmann fold flavoprotein [Litorivivens sp.]|jgi:predicted Rossmann fold flavoprotein